MMFNINKTILLVAITLLCFLPGFALPQGSIRDESWEKEQKRLAEYFAEPDMLRLPGNYLRAIMIAYKDFREKIKEYEKDKRPVLHRMSKIDNYWITIWKKEDHYRIWFQLTPFEGQLMKDGGALYIIDNNTFKILDKR